MTLDQLMASFVDHAFLCINLQKKLQFPSNETEEAAISFKRKWDLNKIRTVQSGRPIPVILY